jgi:UDP-N-acetylmuramoyl-tripeptide--D-alanyl-D-alanine ligase
MAEPLWTSDEIVAATGGTSSGGGFSANGVSIDTRTLLPGDLFVALAGERDGHGFVAQAMSKGAAGVLASQPVDAPAVVVSDTLKALEKLGVAARDRAQNARRCAVTGSVGKTSVTQAIAAALKLAGPSHNSVLSYNNHIGVPLTLARMPRETQRAVFEIGMNHADEIRPLVKMVRPHVAVVTVVGSAHVENFPDGEAGVARAKAEIFEGLEPGGVAVLNADNQWFALLAEAAGAHGAQVLTFGTGEGCDARLLSFETEGGLSQSPSPLRGGARGGGDSATSADVPLTPPSPCPLPRKGGEGSSLVEGPGAVIVATLHGQTLRFPIAQTGAHWGPNSLATLLAVEALGASIETAIEALGAFAPLAGRGETHALTIGGAAITLIDESYNANPISMRAALATLGAAKASGRKIAVLTDMLEMGEGSPALHAALAEPIAAAGVDQVFLAGTAMRALWDVLPETRRGAWRETAEALAPEVRSAVRNGDVVMAKGSKGSKASLVVQTLLSAADPETRRAGGAR